jgi:hypothetical protein
MNNFPFLAAYLMSDSSDSSSSSSSSSESDSSDSSSDSDASEEEEDMQYYDMMEADLEKEPEDYHAEPGRPRTLEEGMAKFTDPNFKHFTRFTKDELRAFLPQIRCPQYIKTAG